MKKVSKDLSIVFLSAYEETPYAGPLRPFLNWTKYLKSEIDVRLYLLKCGKKIEKSLSEDTQKVVSNFQKKSEITEELEENDPDILIGDDHYPRLKLLDDVKPKHTKTGVYIQFLRGIYPISRTLSTKQLPFLTKLKYKLSSLVPFKLITRGYVSKLQNYNLIFSNSQTSHNFLEGLYNIMDNGIVYPPVDTNVFKPSTKENSESVVLYIGSGGGDVNKEFLMQIVRELKKRKIGIHLIGNEELGSKLSDMENSWTYHKNFSDEELAELYSSSLFTICPQKWELFGYAPAESMACGTPVLAFNHMGFAESVIEGKTGLLSNNEGEFLQNLDKMLGSEVEFDSGKLRDYVEEKFSIQASGEKLLKKTKSDL